MKNFALSLAFIMRLKATRKWPIENVHGGHVEGAKPTIKDICIKMKFISQRKIILLFRSSNMAAVNKLYYYEKNEGWILVAVVK